jgi:adenosine deaminase
MTEPLKKAELHCHLGGILSPDYGRRIKKQGFPTNLDPDQLASYFPITNREEWFKMGTYLDPFQHNQGLFLKEILKLYCEDLIGMNVTYAEIMLTHILFEEKDFEKECLLLEQYALLKKEIAHRLELNFLICIGRKNNRQKMELKVNRIIKLFDRGYIQGFSFAADESACNIKDYKDIFDDLYRRGIPIEIHAGEWRGPESIWDALEYGHPRRIGHGISACEDPVLMDHLEKEQIHLEVCPTSNLLLTKYNNIKTHPVNLFRERGLNFSINTDDPGHFGCTMASEFSLLEKELGFDKADFDRIYQNSLTASFS